MIDAKTYRVKATVEAKQWQPGIEIEGVVNGHDPAAKSYMLCGCLLIGGPSEPHIHMTGVNGFILHPGDWVVKHEDGRSDVMSDATFKATYE